MDAFGHGARLMECQVELAELAEVEHLREPMVLEEMVAEAEPVAEAREHAVEGAVEGVARGPVDAARHARTLPPTAPPCLSGFGGLMSAVSPSDTESIRQRRAEIAQAAAMAERRRVSAGGRREDTSMGASATRPGHVRRHIWVDGSLRDLNWYRAVFGSIRRSHAAGVYRLSGTANLLRTSRPIS